MTALEIIKKSALLLNVKEVLEDDSLTNVTDKNCETIVENNFVVNRMYEILKILLTNIASDYAPIIKFKKVKSQNQIIKILDVDKDIKFMQVRKDNIPVKYKLYNDNINLAFDGEFEIKYSQTPTLNNLLEDINFFNGQISSDLLVYGLSALYCLAVGLFDEFNVYNTIYMDRLSAVKALKIIDMPYRRWE